ncbi:S8 family serine peptidase [Piscibacillus halophilus]|uniref:S8 family serine peptidase n=1 Tax=Piscibacillus halophilus TaxID=571933 RepID=UPI00158B746E|nr:S8 family serine peptidase [Piscibacillus halophilus]
MRLIITFITLTILLCMPSYLQAQEATWIMEVENDPEEAKQYIEEYYPFIEVEYVYDTLMQAVVVTGKQRHVKDLHDEPFVNKMSPVQSYSVPQEISKSEEDIHPERARYHPSSMPFTGKGVKVGVVDTGVDYQHPDLEKSYHGGFDVVDFDEDPMETKPDEGMPTLHGTHVSGIIAGNGTMQGVAPEADLFVYRALGPGGAGSTAQVIAALEQAVKDDMDIINLSLGSETNSPDDPMTRAVNKAVDLGKIVVVANGNSGPEDWTVGSPATSEKAISVGAAITEQTIAQISTHDSEKIPVRQLPSSPKWELKRDQPLIAIDSVDELDESIHDRVVLMKKGDTPYNELIPQLEEKGVTAALFYNESNDDPNEWEWVEASFPTAYVTEEEAEQLMQGDEYLKTDYQTVKNALAPFSSRGPVASTWTIKPDLIAPGVEIVSTVPDGYASLQGTSMAAPYVAGVTALIKQAYPDDTPEQIKSRLLSSTNLFTIGDQELSPSEQGTGFVDTEKAITQKYTIDHNRLNFGKIEDSLEQVERSITITNNDRNPLSVKFNIPKREAGIVWDLPLNTTIGPNEKRTFNISANITPDRLEKGTKEGYIEVQLNDDLKHLPYLFINETSDYPRITGLELDMAPFQNERVTLRFYTNEPIDLLTVTLIDPKNLQATELFTESELSKGVFEKEFEINELPKGEYQVVFEIEQEGEILYEEKEIYLPEF